MPLTRLKPLLRLTQFAVEQFGLRWMRAGRTQLQKLPQLKQQFSRINSISSSPPLRRFFLDDFLHKFGFGLQKSDFWGNRSYNKPLPTFRFTTDTWHLIRKIAHNATLLDDERAMQKLRQTEETAPTRCEDLELGSIIAKGCNGAVWSARIKSRAHVEGDEFALALKMVYNYDTQSSALDVLQRFCAEKIPFHLDPHPNILRPLSSFADRVPSPDKLPGAMEEIPCALPDNDGRHMALFVLMQRYPHTLQDELVLRKLSSAEATDSLLQLMEALAHLQRYSIAHLDLKSNNILVWRNEARIGKNKLQLLLADFGCAVNKFHIEFPHEYVHVGGNAALRAPEIATAVPGPSSFFDFSRNDVWAAGALAYELFGVKNPFYEPYALQSKSYREAELPQLPSTAPWAVRQLVHALLCRDPTRRPSATQAADYLHLAELEWSSAVVRPQHIAGWLLAKLVADLLNGNLSKLRAMFYQRACLQGLQWGSLQLTAPVRC